MPNTIFVKIIFETFVNINIMEKNKGTKAVLNAKECVKVFAWIFLIAGIIACFIGFADGMGWSMVIIGVSLAFMAGVHFVIADILVGFGTVVNACETYIKNEEDKVFEQIEDKTIRLPMQE